MDLFTLNRILANSREWFGFRKDYSSDLNFRERILRNVPGVTSVFIVPTSCRLNRVQIIVLREDEIWVYDCIHGDPADTSGYDYIHFVKGGQIGVRCGVVEEGPRTLNWAKSEDTMLRSWSEHVYKE